MIRCCVLAVVAGACAFVAQSQTPGTPRLVPRLTFGVGGGDATAVAFSPDGARLVTGGAHGDLVLWDRELRRQLWSSVAGEQHGVGAVVFSPDGRRIAAMAGDLSLWNADDGTELFRCEAGGSHGLAWSHDGKRLAYHAGKGIVSVLDTAHCAISFSLLQNARYAVHSLAFAPDDGSLLIGGSDKVRRCFFDPPHEQVLRVHAPRRDGGNFVRHVAWLGDEPVSVGWHGDVKVGDGGFAIDGTLFAAATAESGARIAAGGGSGGRVVIWERATGTTRELESGSPTALAFSADGGTLAVASSGGGIVLWRGEARADVLTIDGHDSWIEKLAFTPDGRTLAAAGKHAVCVDLASGERRVLTRQPVSVAPGRRGQELVVGDEAGFAIVDASSFERVEVLAPYRDANRISAFGLRPDGKLLRVGGDRGFSVDYPLPGGERVERGLDRYCDLAWTADGRSAVGRVGGHHGDWGSLLVADADGRVLLERKFRCGVHTVAFSPTGTKLVFARGGGYPLLEVPHRLVVLDARTFEVEVERDVVVHGLRFIDDDLAISYEWGGTVTFWNARTWTPIATQPFGRVHRADLSPDGKTYALTDGRRVQVFAIER